MVKSRSGGIAVALFLIILGLVLPPIALVGDQVVLLEPARSPNAQTKGLSGRTTLPPYYGMLFIFEDDGTYTFWMKDMLVPIDIMWLSREGEVVHIERGVTPESYPARFTNEVPARYVLEMRSGTAAIHSIEEGSRVRFVSLPPWSGVVPSFFALFN